MRAMMKLHKCIQEFLTYDKATEVGKIDSVF
jgi:hypothetical protein